MRISVNRKPNIFKPDFKRVILRFFRYNDERAKRILQLVKNMSDEEVNRTLIKTLREFAKRHRSISKIFEKHFNVIKHFLNGEELSEDRRLLIGSYFSMEYSIESAAFL